MTLSSSLCLNSLEPKDARMALESIRFAEEELMLGGHKGLRGSCLLVAFSGGADSTALLVMACALRGHLGLGRTSFDCGRSVPLVVRHTGIPNSSAMDKSTSSSGCKSGSPIR